jgi:hypothetical protein
MTERQIELTWRCSSCGATNLGRHGECQTCRNPKDGSETWDLPADTTAVPSVTDPALLELATGGPDWRCAFCGSDQRQADGSCRQCGAGKASAEPSVSTKPPIVIRDTGCTWGCGSLLLLLLAVTTLAGFGVFLALRPTPPRSIEPERVFGVREQEVDVLATAVGGRWAESVEVERLDFVAREGFRDEIPRGAIEVKPLGQRVRSVDTVQKGWTTETYEEEVPDGTRTRTVHETVDDGYDTRRTSERVQCGETCERGQETCREVCRPNGNGFATCRQQCTPGPQRCQPKYCNETRSERVPKTRTVSRTPGAGVRRRSTLRACVLVEAARLGPRPGGRDERGRLRGEATGAAAGRVAATCRGSWHLHRRARGRGRCWALGPMGVHRARGLRLRRVRRGPDVPGAAPGRSGHLGRAAPVTDERCCAVERTDLS